MAKVDKETVRLALGLRIRQLREEQGIGLRKFALMIGISKDYLVDLEYGRKSPTVDTLIKVAGGLDVSLSKLLEGIDKKPRKSKKPKAEKLSTTRI